MLKIAIDTGGTFTDYTSYGNLGNGEDCSIIVKNPTNHHDPAAGIVDGLKELAAAWHTDIENLLANTETIAHGATLALNALLEKKGVKTALFTTEGFRDALEIRRSQLKNQWDLRALAPEVLVPRRLRLGITERLNYAGEELKALDEASVRRACAKCREAGVEAVAVCFLFSFLNPEHEKAAAAIIRQELPGVFVSLSSEVAPRIREYERTVTTVINAYLTPVLADYLKNVKERLAAYGWSKPVHIMMNSGSLSDIDAMSDFGVKTLLSGPGGGAVGNSSLGKLTAKSHTVLADMGGTSFDIHVISGGSQRLVSDSELAGYPLTIPMIDISSIGAGGGSIARVDGGGRLSVGPESAGSVPGPACYGLGGTEATVTDALLLLGLVDEKSFLGGRMKLSRKSAEEAIKSKVAEPLGVDVLEAAQIIYKVAGELMADSLRLVTMKRGNDPRHYSLIAAGGAFPLFAGTIAASLHMPEVLIPIQGPVFCSWGMLGAGCGYDMERSFFMEKKDFAAGRLNDTIEKMKVNGNLEMERLNVPAAKRGFEVVLSMRYLGQHHEIRVAWPKLFFKEDDLAVLDRCFHKTHADIYQYSEKEAPWEIIDIHLRCYESRAENRLFPFEKGNSVVSQVKLNGAAFGAEGNIEVKVYSESSLADKVICGPALVRFPYTTAVIPQGYEGKAQYAGILSLRKAGE